MTSVVDPGAEHLRDDGPRARVQRLGRHLAGMIMPNIGAFIAWGLITALFVPTGWWPDATLARLAEPMITYLLPLLIGYTGGHLVHGRRGAVVGAVATIGVVVGAGVPMLLGAMVVGPLAAHVLRRLDAATDGRVRAGFEMLVANFALGTVGGVAAVLGLLAVGPVVDALTRAAGAGVDVLVADGLLPLAALVVEPAKVLFLNNAVNHGVLSTLGAAQAAATGRSVLFMIETNPGPGLGILLAYQLLGPRRLRPTVPGAVVVHLLGGIHEIYFPYVLMKPRLVLAAVAGGASGVATALLLGAGLVAPPSPGSIVAYLAVTPRGGHLAVLLAVAVAAAVSFAVAAALLGFGRSADDDAPDPPRPVAAPGPGALPDAAAVRHLVVACDSGMGSSVMLAARLRGRLEGCGVRVDHAPVDGLPPGAGLVLCHADLAGRARRTAPGAVVVPFRSFVDDPVFDRVVQAVRDGAGAPAVLTADAVRLGCRAADRADAVRRCGAVLVEIGAVQPGYVRAMEERERELGTAVGNGVAIPHGTAASRALVRRTALVVLQFPDGVDWDGVPVRTCVGIAARGDEHVRVLSSLARIVADPGAAQRLHDAATAADVLRVLGPLDTG
jgi:PTS system mannitol-specific IIC component